MSQHPLVSIGQGDYRRDYSGDDLSSSLVWLLALGLALGVLAAVLLGSIGGARIDDSRTTSNTTGSGAHGS